MRDPRIDPQNGDRLRLGPKLFLVTFRWPKTVAYREARWPYSEYRLLRTWQRDMKDAEIVEAGL